MNPQSRSKVFFFSLLIAAALSAAHSTKSQAQSAPIEIRYCSELQNIGKTTKSLSGSYILDNDVYCNELNFTPIGENFVTGFTGVFDGQGHSISNLTINVPNDPQAGLFSYIAPGAQVRNLSLFWPNVTGHDSVGALAGVSGQAGHSPSEIINVFVSDDTVNGVQNVGGLVGKNYGEISKSVIQYLSVNGAVNAGGLVGLLSGNGSIEGSSVEFSIYSNNPSGDVIGVYAGGLVGFLDGTATILNSDAEVHVSSIANAPSQAALGGLVGFIDDSTLTSGMLPYIANAYAAGQVDHLPNSTRTGGVVGALEKPFNFNFAPAPLRTFWDTTTTGQATDAFTADPSLNPEPTSMMYKAKTYTNWNFDSIWRIQPGIDYPHLLWDPIQIRTCQDLENIGNIEGFPLNAYYQILPSPTFSCPANYNPIASQNGQIFTGDLNGLGNYLYNLNNSLFGKINGTVRNLSLYKPIINSTGDAGALAQDATGGIYSNITVYDGKIAGGYASNTGGLFGRLTNGQLLYSSAYNTTLTGQTAGGLVGDLQASTISNGSSSGMVLGQITAGGLVGHLDTSTIENSYSISSVSGQSGKMGGLIGFISGAPDDFGRYTPSYNNHFLFSYAGGRVILSNQGGGFIGGGLIDGKTSTAKSNYWDIEATGQNLDSHKLLNSNGSLLPVASPESNMAMHDESTFDKWDFTNTWRMSLNEDPQLKKEPVRLTLNVIADPGDTNWAIIGNPIGINCTFNSKAGCSAIFPYGFIEGLIFQGGDNAVVYDWGINTCPSPANPISGPTIISEFAQCFTPNILQDLTVTIKLESSEPVLQALVQSNHVKLSWTTPKILIYGSPYTYQVFRAAQISGNIFGQFMPVDAQTKELTQTDTCLYPGKTYEYYVKTILQQPFIFTSNTVKVIIGMQSPPSIDSCTSTVNK